MARSKGNIVLNDFSGTIAQQLVVKQYSFGMVLSQIPDMSRVKKSKARLAYEKLFSKAVAFAQSILNDPAKKKAYQKTLRKGKSVYHAAIKEYMKKNKI